MIVVSDTTPRNYLVLIGAIDVLPRLFTDVLTTPSVLSELAHDRAPAEVRAWAASPPKWLMIESPQARLPSTHELDAGEADAISLAKERSVAGVLIDEYQGRKIAEAEGLPALPTITILELAAEQGLIDLPATIAALTSTTYRVRPAIIEAALKRDEERRRG